MINWQNFLSDFGFLSLYVLILPQDSISVSNSGDTGLVVIEKVESFKQVNELDSVDRYILAH